jgi:hypothetical protein
MTPAAPTEHNHGAHRAATPPPLSLVALNCAGTQGVVEDGRARFVELPALALEALQRWRRFGSSERGSRFDDEVARIVVQPRAAASRGRGPRRSSRTGRGGARGRSGPRRGRAPTMRTARPWPGSARWPQYRRSRATSGDARTTAPPVPAARPWRHRGRPRTAHTPRSASIPSWDRPATAARFADTSRAGGSWNQLILVGLTKASWRRWSSCPTKALKAPSR